MFLFTYSIYIYVCYRLFIHNVEILLRVMGVESPCLSTSHNKVIENRTIFIDICLQQWLTQKTHPSIVLKSMFIQFGSLSVDFFYHVLVMIVSPCNS